MENGDKSVRESKTFVIQVRLNPKEREYMKNLIRNHSYSNFAEIVTRGYQYYKENYLEKKNV